MHALVVPATKLSIKPISSVGGSAATGFLYVIDAEPNSVVVLNAVEVPPAASPFLVYYQNVPRELDVEKFEQDVAQKKCPPGFTLLAELDGGWIHRHHDGRASLPRAAAMRVVLVLKRRNPSDYSVPHVIMAEFLTMGVPAEAADGRNEASAN